MPAPRPRPTPPCAASACSYLPLALRYAAMTVPGTLPRSLTARPFSRAQARTSALVGRPLAPETDRPLDLPEPGVALAADGRDCFDPEPLRGCPSGRGTVLLAPSSIGLVASRSPATTSRTPYIAPRTRSASSSGSVESRVIFIAVAFQHIHRCGNPDRERCSTLQGKRLRPVPNEVLASAGRLHRHTPPRLETLTSRRFGSPTAVFPQC
jgi:hypothetical protein